MSQTAGKNLSAPRMKPTVDGLAALKKLEEAERLASECSRLDQLDDAGQPNDAMALRETLKLWLTWNKAHQAVTSQLFKDGKPGQQAEDMMDELDRMRLQAVESSERLIS